MIFGLERLLPGKAPLAIGNIVFCCICPFGVNVSILQFTFIVILDYLSLAGKMALQCCCLPLFIGSILAANAILSGEGT